MSLAQPGPEPTLPDTRARLLRAALSVFARRDFEAVSVREIVERADANVAAVSYHFGGKQGLYLATAGFLADAARSRIGPILEDCARQGASAGRSRAANRLSNLIKQLCQLLLEDGFGDDAAGFILREQLQPTAAFDILFEKLMQPVHQTYQLLIDRVRPTPAAQARQDILSTHALMGQILAFRVARTTLLRRLGQTTLSDQDISDIAQQIVRLTLRALDVTNPEKTR